MYGHIPRHPWLLRTARAGRRALQRAIIGALLPALVSGARLLSTKQTDSCLSAIWGRCRRARCRQQLQLDPAMQLLIRAPCCIKYSIAAELGQQVNYI